MHICSLEEDENAVWTIPKTASFWKAIQIFFRRRTVVSKKNPRCKVYFRSSAAIGFERRRHIKSKLLHIIHPLSIFRICWETIMAVVFFLALVFNPMEPTYNLQSRETFRHAGHVLDCIIDFVCLLDIIMTFFTGYTISRTKEVVLDPVKIAKRYLSTYFIADLLSSIPKAGVSYLYLFIIKKYDTLPFIRLLPFLKIVRLFTFMVYLERTADVFNMNEYARKIVRYITLTFLLVHWTACMNYFIPQLISVYTGEPVSADSWISQADLIGDYDEWYIHGQCLFRATCFLLTANYGMYLIITGEDAIVGIISYLVGSLFFLYMVVMILQMFMSTVSAETKYQAIINQLQEYMRHKQLPISMQKRLISFYEYRFQKAYFRETVITETVSEKLRVEINIHCCRRIVDSVSIFKDLPPQVVADVVSKLKAEVFLPNDIIVRAGTFGDAMYFLAYGTVSVETPTGKEVCHLQDGAYFGEISVVLPDQKRVANVIAIEICEVYRLDRSSFITCFSSCPQIYQKLKNVAEGRIEQTLMMGELHKKYLDQETQGMFGRNKKYSKEDPDD